MTNFKHIDDEDIRGSLDFYIEPSEVFDLALKTDKFFSKDDEEVDTLIMTRVKELHDTLRQIWATRSIPE